MLKRQHPKTNRKALLVVVDEVVVRREGAELAEVKLMNNIFCEDGNGLSLGIVDFKP